MSMPIYKMDSTFDNIKIIFNTLMGDPRYEFKPSTELTNLMVAYNKFDENVFGVHPYQSGNISEDAPYAESMIGNDRVSDYKEFGKLFYTFGTYAFKLLASVFVKKDAYGKRIVNEDERLIVEKLGISFGKNFINFQTLIGIRDRDDKYNNYVEKGIYHLDCEQIISSLNYVYDLGTGNNNSTIELGEILAIVYNVLTIYLTGIVLNYSEKFGITYETLYGEGNSYTIDTFADRLIGASTIENELKYKLISLFYTYYIMTSFYESHLGISITDKLNEVFVKIGEKISKLDTKFIEKELDITHLTQSDLNRKSTATILSLFSSTSVIKEPAIFDSYLQDNDIVDGCAIANDLIRFTNRFSIDDADKIKNVAVAGLNAYLDDTGINESIMDIMYNHFIDNVANSIPHTLSPKYFFRLSVYAAGFKKLKETKKGKIREMAALGSFQAEGIMTSLLSLWFSPTLSFITSKGVLCNDIRAIAKEYKAKAYILINMIEYDDFISKLMNKEDKRFSSHLEFDFNSLKYNVIDKINDNREDLTECKQTIDNLSFTFNNHYYYPIISDYNFEKFDLIANDLNSGKITFPLFYIYCEKNQQAYRYNYINSILENDYSQLLLDKLSEYCVDVENEPYPMMFNSKLSLALSNNISEIIKNEGSSERFDIYFNIFIKCIIPLQLAKYVYDKSDINLDDKLELGKYEMDNALPNIQSNRLFNFLKK